MSFQVVPVRTSAAVEQPLHKATHAAINIALARVLHRAFGSYGS